MRYRYDARAGNRAAGHLHLPLPLQQLECRLDDREIDTEPQRHLGALQLAGKMQVLQGELGDEVEAEARLVEGVRRRAA